MKKSPTGFTLVELLLVIAIIGLLAGLVSPAIIRIVGTANEKRVKNNAKRLEAAIMEYWHDMGRWPVEKDAQPTLTKAGKMAAELGSEEEVDTFTYKIFYKGDNTDSFAGKHDNGDVVEKLLDAPLPDGINTKTFLDLHGFSTPVGKPPYQWPVSDVEDAFYATNSSHRVLVYFANFVKCPHCHKYSLASSSQCSNNDCEYYKSTLNGVGKKVHYRFTKEQKRHPISGAVPYMIEFDLDNNVVIVHDDPGKLRLDREDDDDTD